MNTIRYFELANTHDGLDPAQFKARVSVNLITNFTDAPLQKMMIGACLEHAIYPNIFAVPYKQYPFFLANRQSELYAKKANLSFIFFDVNPYLQSPFSSADSGHFNETIVAIREYCGAQPGPVIMMNFAVPYQTPYGNLYKQSPLYETITLYNRELETTAAEISNLHIMDTNKVLHCLGERQSRDFRGLYAFDIPFSNDFFSVLAREWLAYIFAITGKMKKCIVVDLDNTLWGGIIGEIGAEAISLGPEYPGIAFQNFQRALLECFNRGILLAINSRNNPTDVEEVFARNPHMILQKDHFAAMRVNWNNKADNLSEIAQELNIGLDSMVFIDDDPVNRELVKQYLPDVLVPDYSLAPENYAHMLLSLPIFSQFTLTDEDREKNRMYLEERERKNVLLSSGNLADYISQLHVEIEMSCNNKDLLERLSQLVLKTNQFNLTTIRHSAKAIEDFMERGLVFAGDVTDKFGGYGITILAMVDCIDQTTAVLDTFLMSCRILGRGIESGVMDYIIRRLAERGITRIKARFIPTAKNAPARDFLSSFGFILFEEKANGEKACELSLTDYLANPLALNAIIIKEYVYGSAK